MSDMTDFDKLLNDINRLNEQDEQLIYVLSKNDTVPFKPLTLKQQKEIITSTTHETPTMEFLNVLDKIIEENCLDVDTVVRNIDRSLIALQMRADSVGSVLELYNKQGETLTVDLNTHIESVKNSSNDVENMLNFTVKSESIRIDCEVPTLKQDGELNNRFSENNIKTDSDTLDKMVGDVYVYEVLKYIKTISTQQTKLNLQTETDLDSKIKIIENMPMSLCNEIVKNIKQVRNVENQSLKSDQLEGLLIPVDATIFTSE